MGNAGLDLAKNCPEKGRVQFDLCFQVFTEYRYQIPYPRKLMFRMPVDEMLF